jgi:hypothetical protein
MNNSDIIALAAIIMSAIISVTSTVAAYFINKSNIQAKRSEIALEKRLEAFREVIEKIGKIRSLLVKSNEANIDSLKSDFQTALEDFYIAYRKNLVFLPPSISDKVAKYGSEIYKVIHYRYTYKNIESFFQEYKEFEKQFIADMQKFIGYM